MRRRCGANNGRGKQGKNSSTKLERIDKMLTDHKRLSNKEKRDLFDDLKKAGTLNNRHKAMIYEQT